VVWAVWLRGFYPEPTGHRREVSTNEGIILVRYDRKAWR
jgi:hypothetical protein